MADALSRLYVRNTHSNDELDPNQPLLILKNLKELFPIGTSPKTIEMVAKHCDKYIDKYGTLHKKLSDGSTIP